MRELAHFRHLAIEGSLWTDTVLVKIGQESITMTGPEFREFLRELNGNYARAIRLTTTSLSTPPAPSAA